MQRNANGIMLLSTIDTNSPYKDGFMITAQILVINEQAQTQNVRKKSIPQGGGASCQCAPYKDGFMITAQILVIIAFLLSFGWWLNWVFGLTALIMLQVAWCCTMGRCGLITAGVFAAITGALLAVQAIAVADNGKQHYCDEKYEPDEYDDDFFNSGDDWFISRNGSYLCNNYSRRLTMLTVTTLLWLSTAVTVFIFACSGRIVRNSPKFQPNQTQGNGVELQTSGVPLPASQPTLAQIPNNSNVAMMSPTPGVPAAAGLSSGVAVGDPSSIKAPGTGEPVAIASMSYDAQTYGQSVDTAVTYLPDGSQKV
eukprot:CAMPEP_0119570150 /NCGR_PEP_ID=MMETSP1352-20130426/43466_1 /TAXON_ID=265584 /ORGANISM="Stauroneis constricta, Strain CCMP1120" /LENGTH=310 /DNA_ID=CAMNT_0007619815 /DNA_START=354 /DNA_END=1287 /DNA_ORIENTATION=-